MVFMHASLNQIRILQGEAIPKKDRRPLDVAAHRIKGKGLAAVCKTRTPFNWIERDMTNSET